MAFASWQGFRPSPRQKQALAIEARRLGIPVHVLQMRKVAVHDKRRISYAEVAGKFSLEFSSYNIWREKPQRSSAYQRRVEGYLIRHPHATLAEARGHRRK